MAQRGGLDVAGSARLELTAGVVHLRPEDAMVEAMLRGWRAQQLGRGLREDSIAARDQLIRRLLVFTNEYPWQWTAAHVDEWSSSLVAERHLAPSTVRSYQGTLRLFTEFLTDGRYGWAVACEEAFGTFPVAICHEWNTIAHLQQYEGRPDSRAFTRAELQRLLDYADEQGRPSRQSTAQGCAGRVPRRDGVQGDLRVGVAAHRDREAGPGGLGT